MSPAAITDDYYNILKVEFNATTEAITKAYRRLAKELHPDRNTKPGATQAFQLLGAAYEVLKDEHRRLLYDRNDYPNIPKTRPAATNSGTGPSFSSASSTAPKSASAGDEAELARLRERKRKRASEWDLKIRTLNPAIQELEKGISQLKQQIQNLDSVTAAEMAEERWKKSWSAWAFSAFSKKAAETEEQKAGKDRTRQERRIEKDMKERRLATKESDLRSRRDEMARGQTAVDAGDLNDDASIWVVQDRIRTRQGREREERERERIERENRERERLAREWEKMRREQMERDRQERERLAKLQREKQAQQAAEAAEKMRKANKERRRQAEEERKRREVCIHGGWWAKIHGRTSCPRCDEVWTYLLQCPGCDVRACPKCQAEIRPGRRRARETRTPREDYWANWDD